MKKLFFICMLIVLASVISFSCKKESSSKKINNGTTNSASLARGGGDKFQLSVKPLSIAELRDIKNNLRPYLDLENRPPAGWGISTEPIYTNVALTDNELAIKSILQPLTDKGKEIYDELILKVQETPEWQELDEEERNAMLNMNSESQYVELALMYSTTGGELGGLGGGATVEGISGEQILHCLASVVGITFIKDTITGIFTWNAALSLVRFILKRYVCWIALALTVYDTIECLAG